MALGTLINAAKQVRAKTIDTGLFTDALNARLDKIETTETSLSAVAGKFGGDGKLLNSYVPATALKGYAGSVATEAAMLALTVNLDSTPIGEGDMVDRSDLNQTWHYIGGGTTSVDNWKPILTPQTGVTSLRNVSGSIVNQKDMVTLADVAFNGLASSVNITSGAFSGATVQAALETVKTAADNAATAAATASAAAAGKLAATQLRRSVNLTGTINGTNAVFVVPEAFAADTLQLYAGGQRLRPTTDYSVSGQNVTLNFTPDYETERPFADFIAA